MPRRLPPPTRRPGATFRRRRPGALYEGKIKANPFSTPGDNNAFGPTSARVRWGSRSGEIVLDDFAGGVNTRDDLSAIPQNESGFGTHDVHFDSGGAVTKRLVHAAYTGMPALPAGTPGFLFYSSVLNLFFTQVGTQLYRAAPGAGAWTATGAVFGSTASIAMCDFAGRVVYCHPVSGTFTYNVAEGVVNRSATVKGSTIAVWQNYAWVGGDPTDTTTQARLYRSKVGDPTVWAAPDGATVDLREKDSEIITALHGGTSLLVFKRESGYKVTDSSTGSFSTLDWESGCLYPVSIAGLEGRVYTIGLGALYEWSGVGPALNVGDKLRPQFATDATPSSAWGAAFSYQRRIFFLDQTSSQWYQYSPESGALTVAYDFAAIAAVAFYQSKPRAIDVNGLRYTLFDTTGHADRTGFDISPAWDSPYLTPGLGRRCRFRQLRVYGQKTGGNLNLRVTVLDASGGIETPSTYALDLATSSTMNEQIIRSLGHGHSIKLELLDQGDTTTWFVRRFVLDYELIESQ